MKFELGFACAFGSERDGERDGEGDKHAREGERESRRKRKQTQSLDLARKKKLKNSVSRRRRRLPLPPQQASSGRSSIPWSRTSSSAWATWRRGPAPGSSSKTCPLPYGFFLSIFREREREKFEKRSSSFIAKKQGPLSSPSLFSLSAQTTPSLSTDLSHEQRRHAGLPDALPARVADAGAQRRPQRGHV